MLGHGIFYIKSVRYTIFAILKHDTDLCPLDTVHHKRCLSNLVLYNFGEVLAHFGQKNSTPKKSAKLIKITKLKQVFMHNFLSWNVPIPPNCILPTCTKIFVSPCANL